MDQPASFSVRAAAARSTRTLDGAKVTNARLNEPYRRELHHSVVETCRALIDGRAGPVEVSRRLVALAHELGADRDEDFVYFVGLDSETDHFPLGESRQHWSAAALAREDAKRAKYDVAAHADAAQRCRNLLLKYEQGAV